MAALPERTPTPRRTAILAAALSCFSERGYAATTIDEVRRAAGASVGSMYHHFPGKEQLAAAVVVEGKRAYYAAWLAAIRGRRSAEAGVRAAVRRHFEWIEHNGPLGRFVFGYEEPAVVAAAADEGRAARSAFQEALLSWLQPHVEAGDVKHLPDDVYEPLWMGAAQSFTRQWLGWDDLAALARFHRHFGDAAWESLRAD